MDENQIPLITVGIPVYNGKKFIKKRIENILAQTYNNFEIIISDNASEDDTEQICKQFQNNDKRITYIKQNKNIGMIQNYIFLANTCKTEYFVYAAIDDMWEPDFLKDMLNVLQLDKKIVCCFSKIKFFGSRPIEFIIKKNDNYLIKTYKNFRNKFRQFNTKPIHGKNFEKRGSMYIRHMTKGDQSYMIYSLIRTLDLKKSILINNEYFWQITCLNLLRYGNFFVIDKILIHYNSEGSGFEETLWSRYKKGKLNILGVLFPWYKINLIIIKYMGKKFFVKNILSFILLNLHGFLILITSTYHAIKK